MTDGKTEQPTGEPHEAPEEPVTYTSVYERLKATQEAAGALHPPLHGLEAHVKPACYRTQRGATPNRGNHLSTTLLGPAFYAS